MEMALVRFIFFKHLDLAWLFCDACIHTQRHHINHQGGQAKQENQRLSRQRRRAKCCYRKCDPRRCKVGRSTRQECQSSD